MPSAEEIARRYKSPRYCRIETYEKYVDGTQYDGRAPFLATDEHAPPLLERAPCIVYGITKTAIKDLIAFMMGDARYPFFSAATSEDDEQLDDDWGLNEDDSELLERWLNGPLTRCARLKAIFPQATSEAMRAGSVVLVGAIRKGIPHVEVLPSKWCTPAFDPASGEIFALDIKYPYLQERFNDATGKWECVCLVYRRLITKDADIVFFPGIGREDGRDPVWTLDPSQTTAHGLGFCPVVWYAFNKGEPTPANYDGTPLHCTLTDEIDALNFSLSQRHRAALTCGDPQIVETGVDEDVNPAPMGRAANIAVEPRSMGPDGKVTGVFSSGRRGGGSMRKKGPGVIWRYPDGTSKVELLELSPGSLDAISDNAEDIRRKLAEDMSVMLLDPTDASKLGALSGRALAFLFSRQIAFCDSLRLDLANNLMLPLVDLLMRLICAVEKKFPGGLRIPGMKRVQPMLDMFEREIATNPAPNLTEAWQDQDGDEQPGTEWLGPRLELQWGAYFEMSAEEELALVQMVVQAYTKGVIPLSLAVEKLREVFRFTSVEEIIKRIEEERAKKQQEAQANAAAMAKIDDTKKSDDAKNDNDQESGLAAAAE